MFVMCPSAGRSAECCVMLALMVAPRGRALVFLNMGCGRQKIATSGYRAWGSRRRAVERTSPPDVICAMCAHQTHVHSWRRQTGGLNGERAAPYSFHSNCSSTCDRLV